MNRIKWQEPPASGRRSDYRTRFTHLADQLRNNPQQWALIDEGKTTSAANYARKRLGDGFEVVSRTNDGRQDIYARFVGEAATR